MNTAKVCRTAIGFCVTIPIWLYLVYKILLLVEATELMWFLYWIYVPAVVLVSVLNIILDEKTK